jgi:hypothetical protein
MNVSACTQDPTSEQLDSAKHMSSSLRSHNNQPSDQAGHEREELSCDGLDLMLKNLYSPEPCTAALQNPQSKSGIGLCKFLVMVAALVVAEAFDCHKVTCRKAQTCANNIHTHLTRWLEMCTRDETERSQRTTVLN